MIARFIVFKDEFSCLSLNYFINSYLQESSINLECSPGGIDFLVKYLT